MKRLFIGFFVIFLITSASFPLDKSLDKLLENPFDVHKFKKLKGESNSGSGNKRNYYFKPKQKGFYYSFFMFRRNTAYKYAGSEKVNLVTNHGLKITTYKPRGAYEEKYFDPTETLIEVFATSNDRDLPELAFIGLDMSIVKKKLGNNFIRKDSFFIYAKNKNVKRLG